MSQLFGGKSKQKVQKVNDLKSVHRVDGKWLTTKLNDLSENRFVKWLTAKLNDFSENRFVKWLTAKFNNFSENRVVKWVTAIIDCVLILKQTVELNGFGGEYKQKVNDLYENLVGNWLTAIIEFVLVTLKQIGVPNGFGGEYKHKLLFVPDADNKPEDKHEISEVELFRFLLNEKIRDFLEDTGAEIPQMLGILKDIDRNSKIVEFETHQSSMGLWKDLIGAFHVFILFKTTSETDGVYWWSLENNGDYMVLQRSRNKDNVKNKLDGGSREKNQPVTEGLNGKGAIKDLFTVLWVQQIIPEKFNIFKSNGQSLVTSVSKEITETGYEYQGVFKYSLLRESDRNKKVFGLINFLRISSDSHPLIPLILIENTNMFDQITENGKYNMLGITRDGLSPLHIAIMFSKTEMVKHLLNPPYRADPTTHYASGMNALHMAAGLTTQPEILDLILEAKKAKTGSEGIDDVGDEGLTALHCAAIESNEITAEHLIQKGADLHIRDKFGRTPLHVAARFAEDMNIIDLFLQNINEGDVQQYKKDGTLLECAYCNENGLGEKIIQLVAKGMVSIEQVQNRGLVVEMEDKVDRRQSECVKNRKGSNSKEAKVGGIPRIIGDNADEMKDKFDIVFELALPYVIRDTDVEKVRRLVKEFGVDISTLTLGKEKRNVLHFASKHAETNMIDVILEKGKLDINRVNNYGRTPLHYAIMGFNTTNARYLLDKGADPTIRDNNGTTPFHMAAISSRDSDILDLFLANSNKFDIDHRNQFGMTALHMAVAASNQIAARFLLSKGANPNAADEDGRTPLHLAALLAKDEDLIDLLLNAEAADVNCVDKKGRTPLAFARDNKNGLAERIISRLKERGVKE